MHLEPIRLTLVSNSRCTSVTWVPGGDGAFVVGHADGNLYVYEKASLKYQEKYFLLPNIHFPCVAYYDCAFAFYL